MEDEGKLMQVRLPAELLAEVDAAAGDRGRPTFVRLALRAFLDHLKRPMEGVAEKAVVVSDAGPVPISDALAVSGIEPQAGEVIAVPRAKASGRGVDADRVIACLGGRRRSARDVANALKLDVATAGGVIGGLIRDGVLRKRADGVLEVV
jgi:hypothetical protein